MRRCAAPSSTTCAAASASCSRASTCSRISRRSTTSCCRRSRCSGVNARGRARQGHGCCSIASGLADKARLLSGAAFRRPAAARGDRTRARDGAAGDAVRRADQRARPRDGRRGAGGHARPGRRRHDDDVRHPRDGLRPRGRRPRLVHGCRPASSRPPSPTTFFRAPQHPRAQRFLSDLRH